MDVGEFFEMEVPARYRKGVEELQSKVSKLQRRLEEVKAADAMIRVALSGDGGGEWKLRVRGGEMVVNPEDAGDDEILFTLAQSLEDFEAGQSGRVQFGIGGGGSSQRDQDRDFSRMMLRFLTRSRIERLRAVVGSVCFEVTEVGGEEDETWGMIMVLGPGDVPESAECKVSVTHADSKLMAEGKLAPPAAFMAGKIRVTGNTALAMQLGTMMMS